MDGPAVRGASGEHRRGPTAPERWRGVARRSVMALVLASAAGPASAALAAGAAAAAVPWWLWPMALFVACFLIGIVAVPAGIGGGTLFVPIVGSLFPFHLDFVRGAGLLVALASALAAGPILLRGGLANLRLALPLAVLASASAIGGALLGLALPAAAVQVLLGCVVLGIAGLMAWSRRVDPAPPPRPDRLATWLALRGSYFDRAAGQEVSWQAQRTGSGLLAAVFVGALGGLFGIGAGWANVPVLSLLMGVPLKIAAGTSGIVLSLSSSAAAWVYLEQGAVLPIIAVPSIAGMMLGARLGARLLHVLDGAALQRLVLVVMVAAGLRALLVGTGLWT